MEYVKYAKIIAQYVLESERKTKRRIQALMKVNSVNDVAVLQTMLERCAESSNRQLQEDLEKHRIPQRLKKVANIVSGRHGHGWNQEACNRGLYTFFQCIEAEGDWNSTAQKAGILSAGVVGGIFMFGIPTVITGNIVYQMGAHADEVADELEFVVKEIENIYDNTNGIILANLARKS